MYVSWQANVKTTKYTLFYSPMVYWIYTRLYKMRIISCKLIYEIVNNMIMGYLSEAIISFHFIYSTA